VRKRVVTVESALAVSSRREQLVGMLERSGIPVNVATTEAQAASSLRLAGSA
jgi:hypothetical protein